MIEQATYPCGRKAIWRGALLLATALECIVLAPSALAQSAVWQGGASPDWFDPANWDTGVPTATDDVYVADPGAPFMPVIDGAAALADVTYLGLLAGEPTGALSIQNSGSLTNGTNAFVGYDTGTDYSVLVTGAGSSWNQGLGLTVGYGGTGSLRIENGGQVNNLMGAIGRFTGSVGAVSVTGTDSIWTNVNDLNVGYGGAGTLEIFDGGTVSNAAGFIGNQAGSDGIVTVTGTGSNWTNASFLFVGNNGIGTLEISDGGTVSSNDGTLGAVAGSTGTVSVNGTGSNWTTFNGIHVGFGGAGTLEISDGGTVSSDIGNIGGQAGSIGMASVTGAGSSWTSTSDFYVGSGGEGTLTIADGGTVSALSMTIGSGAASTGTLNIGAAAGDAAVGAGTLNTPSVSFGAGIGTLNFNHTETDYNFDAAISGLGAINHMAGVTNLIGDGSGFTGTTNITGGTLRVNNFLGGAVNVTGGTLGGVGPVGTVSVNSGGTIAPGNSIGTLNVSSLVFNAGSTYEVEINSAGQNDLITTVGTVTVNGGTVKVVPFPDFVLDTDYTIVSTASGVVVNTLMTPDFDSLFITPTLTHDTFHILLTLSQTADFTSVAMTPNQIAAAGGAQSLGGGELFNAIALLGTEDDARAAFDAISGEIHASAQTALLEDSRFPREAAQDRLRVTLGGMGANNSAQIEDRISESFGMWGQGFGSWSQWDSDGNAAALDRSIGGFILGGDALVWDNVHFGLLGGYSRSGFSVDDRMSSGMADTYTLGAYGGGEWEAFTLTGGLAHSWHGLDTSRIVAFTGFSDNLSASTSARTLQTWGEAAYSFETGTARFEPFANLAYVNLSTDGFTESGGAAALTATSNIVHATYTTLGLRAETDVALGDMNATLRGTLGWRHAFGGTPTAQMNFASGGDSFTVAGVPLAQGSLVFDAGVDLNLTEDATLGLAYGGMFGSGVQDHSAKASLSVRF